MIYEKPKPEWIKLEHAMHLRCKNKAMADEVFERSFAVESGRQNEQGVEPSACLINSLGDEIPGKSVLELFLFVEWVVVLCVGHASTLKPAIKDFRNTS